MDSNWRPLRGRNAQPSVGLSAAWGLATLRAYLFFSCYHELVMLFLNMVCLTEALTRSDLKTRPVRKGVSKGEEDGRKAYKGWAWQAGMKL
jgi:hypothetical protein